MKLIQKRIVSLGAGAAGYFASASAVYAQTQPWTGVCVDSVNTDVATIQGLQCLVANILSVFLTLVGIVAFLMVVVSAFRLLVSAGNSQATEKAKNSVTYAVVGLIVAVSAFIILNLISRFTGVESILRFQIPNVGG